MNKAIKYLFPVMYVLYILATGLAVYRSDYGQAGWIFSALLWMFNYHMLYTKIKK